MWGSGQCQGAGGSTPGRRGDAEYNKYNCKSSYGPRHNHGRGQGQGQGQNGLVDGVQKAMEEVSIKVKVTSPDPEVDNYSPFVDLPELVGERICSFLPPGDLLTLRLVCKGTKSWVEAPRNISKLVIDLRRPSHLLRLLKPRRRTADFTNFMIRIENLTSQILLSTDFATTFGPRMKVLKIKSPSGFLRKIDLLLACPSLEEVSLSDLSLRGCTPEDLATLGSHFANYVTFDLDDLTQATATHVTSLVGWITGSHSLKHLRFPHIQFEAGEPKLLPVQPGQSQGSSPPFHGAGSSPPTQEERVKAFCRSGILQPLIKSLDEKVKARVKVTLKSIDVERLCLHFANDSDLLLELAGACAKHGIRLRNVPFGLLYPKTNPTGSPRSSSRYNPAEAPILSTIESCRGFHLGKINVRYLRNMTGLSWSMGFMSHLQEEEDSYSSLSAYAQELDFPSLEKMSLNIFPHGGATYYEHIKLIQALMTSPRATLSELFLTWNGDSLVHCPISGARIGNSFPNLKVLELVHYNVPDEEFVDLFSRLTHLEELRIKDCKALSDGAFYGVSRKVRDFGRFPRYRWESSPFTMLTKLKKLKIRCYDNGVTDISLAKAFSHLPLRCLSINFIGESSITLDGLSSLTRLPFRNSIQYLNLQLASGISDSHVIRITSQFSNLKGCRID